MATCDVCGKDENMPYQCRMCGDTHCAEHRLPENHSCPGLNEWNDPDGVFDSGFDDSVQNEGRTFSVNTGPGGPLGYFRGNMTYVFLGLMWITFAFQFLVFPVLGYARYSPTWLDVFTLNTANPLYVWTWVTSVFAHGGPMHIFLNSIVLYFFGPPVERRVGSKKFTALFLVSGAVAGLAQVGATIVTSPGAFVPVLGASGAIAAVMGVLTVLNPNLRIYLYFFIPMPLWVATLGFAVYSAFISVAGGIGAGGVAQLAHLTGLGIGLLYGAKLKRDGKSAPEQLQFGGGGGGRMGGPGRGRF
ncbi:rhomboid family intramembrane serine protease [Halomicrococcus gelatinilyticus]|uniref:rhomboid family intramembrane serine protease n=1 Tax=Halomicrococcus gelatinilyticus TaxID=1702103 RepID=UPI002E0E0BE5